ncbi:hypothetical protein GCM10007036_14100 [Alsobacter metallidurans]|uniref:Uncharacterized protein n=1 Tax=Alsobacter metallidurans TaxID=340221 RepID=A0A917I5X8_9HYPH|nr:hypothetical protein [Alsobacter metallidurans]GGH14637.1 hypothetical protein GCM10007036_14100 [Alsobacter metallidurans]
MSTIDLTIFVDRLHVRKVHKLDTGSTVLSLIAIERDVFPEPGVKPATVEFSLYFASHIQAHLLADAIARIFPADNHGQHGWDKPPVPTIAAPVAAE